MQTDASDSGRKTVIYFWIVAVAAVAVYVNTLGGDFVYDDARQILKNSLIQNSSLYARALISDVWAFKGDGSLAASGYYRPTFILWLILNFKVFGANPVGWHAANILLHLGVCLTAFLLLKRWEMPNAQAFAAALIFAVHPVHVESVAWISGSPDLLAAVFILSSFYFADKYAVGGAAGGKNHDLIVSLVLYGFALGSKEIAVLIFPVYFLIFRRLFANARAWRLSALFAAAAVVYFIARLVVLRTLFVPVEDASGLSAGIFSLPRMFLFYLGQIVFPVTLGANYPLRPIENIGVTNFFLPLLISAAIAFLLYRLARQSFAQKLGGALFVLSLVPAMNAWTFPAEQIVHDRYLYLPLLGFLMMIIPFAAGLIGKFLFRQTNTAITVFAVAVSLPLAIKTFYYNRTWLNEEAIWRQAVKIDEHSAFNWSQLGAAAETRSQTAEAVAAYQRSLAVRPTALANLGLGRNLAAQKKYAAAIAAGSQVIALPNDKVNAYTLFQAYEIVSIALTAQNDLPQAEKLLVEARARLPIYRAALTEKLAVVLYLQNRQPEALSELEAARAWAENEFLPASKAVFLRLGMLYAEKGNQTEARKYLQMYLDATANFNDEFTAADRRQANDVLKSLN